MNENIDLTQILKDCPKGTKLYSPIFGEVKFNGLDLEDTYPILIIITSDNDFQEFTKEGLYLAEYNDGECLLFPSKEQRDWSKFKLPKKDLPYGTLVMTSDDGNAWYCNNYDHDGLVIGSTKIWRYIISLADFKGMSFSSEDNYSKGLKSQNSHEYVDLGLPSGLKWATCNVGATNPEDFGDYYAWGETTTKSKYTWVNSITMEKEMGDISGNAEYDAARANWGGTWRIPTKTEIEELINNCTWEWTTQNGVNGYKVTGSNGNSIFLPAAGWRSVSSLYNAGSGGYYWSSTPYESDTNDACNLNFNSSGYDWDDCYRGFGRSVRPVTE